MSESTNPEATPDTAPESAAEATDGQGDTSGTDTVDRAAYDALRAELDTFRRDVVAVTGRYAEAHNLCGVVDSALAELGLRRVQTGHRVTVSLVASWDVKTSSRGKAGAPSDSTVWRQIESLAANLRYDSVNDVRRRFGRDGGDFPNLEITTADVKVETADPGPDAHIIPAVRKRTCSACGYSNNPADVDECRNCEDDMSDDNDDD
jgi:hypothetical protein